MLCLFDVTLSRDKTELECLAVSYVLLNRLGSDVIPRSLDFLRSKVAEELAEIIIHKLLFMQEFIHLLGSLRKDCKIEPRISTNSSDLNCITITVCKLNDLGIRMR